MNKWAAYDRAQLHHKGISRRGLFRGLWKGVQLTEETPMRVPRPPNALEEGQFLALCQGCGDCVIQCSQKVLQLKDGKAQLVLEYNACSLCGDCVNACPTGALEKRQSIATNVKPQFLNHCQRLLEYCQLCEAMCPTQAIDASAENALPRCDASLCLGCGQCQQSCPQQAITMTV